MVHSNGMRLVGRALKTGVAMGALAGAWGLAEAQAFTLRRRCILLEGSAHGQGLAAGQRLRVLQLSDIHLVPHQRRKIAWIQGLAKTQPDLLVLTGDQLSSAKAVAPLLEALAPFAGTAGAFVHGSNDYYGPLPKNPFVYFGRDHSAPREPRSNLVELPWREMTAAFEKSGWINLTNTRAQLSVGDWTIDLVGVDDPHIGLDQFPEPVGADGAVAAASTVGAGMPTPRDRGATNITIGLTHAPYKRILDRMVADECTAVFAGHTHGGQVCLPGVGALVTNCDLERDYASGLFQWPPTGKGIMHGDGTVPTGLEHHPTSWVNVTTGLGTSPFTPVRVACRPEAVLVDFVVI